MPLMGSPHGGEGGSTGGTRFAELFPEELRRVGAFYQATLAEIDEQLTLLEQQARRRRSAGGPEGSLLPSIIESPGSPASLEGGEVDTGARLSSSLRSLRRGFLLQYRTAALLENFSVLHQIALAKLAKKCRKSTVCALELETTIAGAPFSDTAPLCHTIDRIEASFAELFCSGSRREAKVLLLERQSDSVADWKHFRLGWRFGAASLLVVWLAWDIFVDAS